MFERESGRGVASRSGEPLHRSVVYIETHCARVCSEKERQQEQNSFFLSLFLDSSPGARVAPGSVPSSGSGVQPPVCRRRPDDFFPSFLRAISLYLCVYAPPSIRSDTPRDRDPKSGPSLYGAAHVCSGRERAKFECRQSKHPVFSPFSSAARYRSETLTSHCFFKRWTSARVEFLPSRNVADCRVANTETLRESSTRVVE